MRYKRTLLLAVVPTPFIVLFLHFLWSPYLLLPLSFYFSLLLLLSFPDFVPSLQKRPVYLHDVIVENETLVSPSLHALWVRKHLYYTWCRHMVNITTACLITACVNYGYGLWRMKQPKSYIEICGILGGVLALLNRAQHLASQILLKLCHLAQEWDEHRNLFLPLKEPCVDSAVLFFAPL